MLRVEAGPAFAYTFTTAIAVNWARAITDARAALLAANPARPGAQAGAPVLASSPAAPVPPLVLLHCRHCGTLNPAESTHCGSCGAGL